MSTLDVGEEFLEHYGVKGMQWGVRRSKKQLTRSSSKSSTKSVKSMSDADLRTAINRMNMEQQYARLSSSGSNRTVIKTGAAFVGGIGMNVARQNIQNALTSKVASVMSTRSATRAARRLPYRFD